MLVHLPGPELLAVTPDTREDFLYDDIIDLENAQKEHRRFVAILERFTTVHLRARPARGRRLDRPTSRDLLVRETLDIVPSGPLANKIEERSPEELVEMLIEGEEEEPGPLARSLNEGGYLLPPLPNLFFTRDTAMVVGDHVMIGSMRYGGALVGGADHEALFLHHPLLANQGILYDGAAERRHNYTLEGGDVHPLRHDTVIIGFSERSSPAAIDYLASRLFEETQIDERHRGRDAEGEHGDPSRHDLHAGRPGSVRRISAALHRPRAAADSLSEEGERDDAGDAERLRSARAGAACR